MAGNDLILVDGILDDRVDKALPSTRRDEVFEYLCFEQCLKDFGLDSEEIGQGSVDGGNDGGVDGFFTFVNGHLLVDAENFSWPRTGAQLETWIFTCKHASTFQQAPIDKLIATFSEILDFRMSRDCLAERYNDDVLRQRELLNLAFRKLSPRLSSMKFRVVYASRGDSNQLGSAVSSRANQAVGQIESLFGQGTVNFSFFGAAELLEEYRKTPDFTLELPYSEVLSSGERYVVLTQLQDYFDFVTEGGKLRRYLFDSNIRDFMGMNRVNEDIKKTLESSSEPDFWCLNNGITVLANSASLVGDRIKIEDIQIVNGLQTTESIYRFFSGGGLDHSDRQILVKVIVTQEDRVRDAIIRATNNQTSVELASLHATDKIQRDIEQIFERSCFFYERRKRFHENSGIPQSQIVTPLYIGAGYVALVLKWPKKASALKSRFMNVDESYDRVFSDRIPLGCYPSIASILKTCDRVLEKRRPVGAPGSDRFLKRWRHLVALIATARHFGRFDFSASDLAGLDSNVPLASIFDSTWSSLRDWYPEETSGRKLQPLSFFRSVCKLAADEFRLEAVGCVEVHGRSFSSFPERKKPRRSIPQHVVDNVGRLLPPQPWKPGVHRKVIEELGCESWEYRRAVEKLIEDGVFNHQRDGIVYDSEGSVIDFDSERVSESHLEAIESDKLK